MQPRIDHDGCEIDLEWAQGNPTRAVVRSTLGGNCRLRTDLPVSVEGASAAAARGPNPNSFFHTVDAGQPQITKPMERPPFKSRPSQTVDFATSAGGTYVLAPAR